MAKFVRTRLVSARFVNMKSYDDFTINFTKKNGEVKRLVGFYGPNGTGKSTALDAISLLFQSFANYDEQRLMTSLQRYVRNVSKIDVSGSYEIIEDNKGNKVKGYTPKIGYVSSNPDERFLIEGTFISEMNEVYTVSIGNDPDLFRWKGEGIQRVVAGLKNDHPIDIKRTLQSQCYLTNYDKELHKFQLRSDRWLIFKRLFEAVTGFPVDKIDSHLSDEVTTGESKEEVSLHRASAMIDEYILNIIMNKPGEKVSDRQFSDGERKITKNFTTLLNKDRIPSIILIDNIEMHVEVDRHMNLLDCIDKCFPDSQVVFTTHSDRIIAEYDLESMISLYNKKISSDDSGVWRHEMLRVIRGLKLCFRGESDFRSCEELEKELLNENFNDKIQAVERLSKIIANGYQGLIEEIKLF